MKKGVAACCSTRYWIAKIILWEVWVYRLWLQVIKQLLAENTLRPGVRQPLGASQPGALNQLPCHKTKKAMVALSLYPRSRKIPALQKEAGSWQNFSRFLHFPSAASQLKHGGNSSLEWKLWNYYEIQSACMQWFPYSVAAGPQQLLLIGPRA